mgnify:CR=1 FL=1
MGKIIIHNPTTLSDSDALSRVVHCVNGGFVSRTNGIDHYCHISTYKDGFGVYCLNRGKDKNTFYIFKENTPIERYK